MNPELGQGQTAQGGQQGAVGGIQFQSGQWGNGLFRQERAGKLAQLLLARGIEPGQQTAALAQLLPQRIVNGWRCRPQPTQKTLDQRNIPGRKLCQRGARMRCIRSSSLPPPPEASPLRLARGAAALLLASCAVGRTGAAGLLDEASE